MTKKKHYFFCLILAYNFFISCENKLQDIKNLDDNKPISENAYNVSLFFSVGGSPRSVLNAPFMIRYTDSLGRQITEFPQKLHIDFYLDSQFINSYLNANYGKFIESENKMHLRDSVVAFNNMGDTVWTDELFWDPVSKTLYSDKKVLVKQQHPFSKINAIGFKSNKDLTQIQMQEISQSYFEFNNNPKSDK